MTDYRNQNSSRGYRAGIDKAVNIPIELYESTLGRYFIGTVDNLSFGNGTSTWARLYNPRQSGVILHVNVWTATDLSEAPFQAEFWFNASAPGSFYESGSVTPSNTYIQPPPEPKVRLQYASQVTSQPYNGIEAFVRNGDAGTTVMDTENGKLIFPPGGSFLVYLTLVGNCTPPAIGRIAFGWWEEPIPV